MDPTRNLHNIILGELPAEGKRFAGVLEEDIFALPPGDPQSTAGITYDLHVTRFEDFLLVTGSLQTSFSLACVRCLAPFPYRVELRGHTFEVDVPNEATLDLTDAIREDILLSLPSYPRCEDSSLGEVQCTPAVKVYSPGDPQPEADETDGPGSEGKQNIWGALDNLGSLNDND